MKLLGIEELDYDTFSKLRRIEKDINSYDKEAKNRARKSAKKLIQNFMVRRTRSDLNYLPIIVKWIIKLEKDMLIILI